jgi:hypothetical protein
MFRVLFAKMDTVWTRWLFLGLGSRWVSKVWVRGHGKGDKKERTGFREMWERKRYSRSLHQYSSNNNSNNNNNNNNDDNTTTTTNNNNNKGKAIPVTGRGSPQGSETSRVPHFEDN